MAIFRKVHTSFWSDSFTSEITSEQKLFYLYLLTNERTRQCGVYEITKRQISFDLGMSIEKVTALLKFFISKGKIKYNEDTKELAIGNWLKYNLSTSPKVISCIEKEFKLVKDTLLIEYVKSIDTETQEEEEEQEEEQEKKKNNIEERKLKFAHSLAIYLPTYGKELIREFYDYWTEHNKSNTKFKQELEKTWNAERRLKTWAERDRSFKGNKTPKIETKEEELARKQKEANRF